MSPPSHPRWGRPIRSYSNLFNADRCALSVDSEIAGLQAMQKISRLATEGYTSAPEDLELDIDISTLESAVRLTLDSTTIRHLANPLVISGCIRLMKGVNRQRTGAASPFSYEYGYLCFKLLAATLNVCLLERWNELEELLASTDKRSPGVAHILTLMRLSDGVLNQFLILVDGGNCDEALGWSDVAVHHRREPLLSQSNISTLLDLLWDDRKLFLQALSRDDPAECGLSGLLFYLSRYVARERDFQQNQEWKSLNTQVYELALRYLLVAHQTQREATLLVTNVTTCSNRWPKTAKHLDEGDSRLIATEFIKLMSNPENSEFLMGRGPSVLLRFVPHTIDRHALGVLPAVMQCYPCHQKRVAAND
ncbi:hypothetical protein RSAG8_11149, partial [Rhizoctonia solani AG-8 WAC10335]